MKTTRIAPLSLFLLAVTTMTFAQSARQIGAWSIYTGLESNNSTVLLQTPAVGFYSYAHDSSNGATLSVICKSHKVRAIALHTTSGTNKHAVNNTQDVPTTPVVAMIEGHVESHEMWGVSERGHTFYPFSDRVQGKVNRHWIARLNDAHTIAFRLSGPERDDSMQPTFDTQDLGEALASVGCTK
jgi:hypothetical protein